MESCDKPLKITVLDGYTLNPGDLSWTELEALGNVTIYDRTNSDEVIPRAADSEIILTNKTVLDKDTIAALHNLKYIGVLATGYNVVDIKAAVQSGITVTNVPAYGTESVAQMVFAHILTITQRVEHYSHENRLGKWSRNPDFCYWDTTLTELNGNRIGIIGFGNTGKATARIAQAFEMDVKVYTSKPYNELPVGIEKLPLEDIFSTCDIISLHCPLTDTTRHIVNKDRLSLMKKSAILINTARGPLVDEYALAEALNNENIHAAGLDVLDTEPPKADNPLLTAKNCFITPHIAWATKEARERLMKIAVNNLKEFLNGHPVNCVI